MDNDNDVPFNPYFECMPKFMIGRRPMYCNPFSYVDFDVGCASSGYVDDNGDIFVERIFKVIK